jgi:hypothetical protein
VTKLPALPKSEKISELSRSSIKNPSTSKSNAFFYAKTMMVTTYQKGPETPYCQATFEDCRRVAAHVHWETITEAVSPVFTIRPAVLKE